MTDQDRGTRQDRWARFRFSVVGPLLSAPPKGGELHDALVELAHKAWCHPITATTVHFSLSTIERWYYQARRTVNPVNALRTKQQADSGQSKRLGIALKQIIRQQYQQYPSWSYQLHYDNLKVITSKSPELGDLPTYHTVRRFMKSQGLTKQRRVKKRDTDGARAAAKRSI